MPRRGLWRYVPFPYYHGKYHQETRGLRCLELYPKRPLDIRFNKEIDNNNGFALLMEDAKSALRKATHGKAFSNELLRVEVSGPDRPLLTSLTWTWLALYIPRQDINPHRI